MERIPDFKLEPNDPKVIAICTHCKQEIYDGETFGVDGDDIICSDCIEDRWNSEILAAKFDMMGYIPIQNGREI